MKAEIRRKHEFEQLNGQTFHYNFSELQLVEKDKRIKQMNLSDCFTVLKPYNAELILGLLIHSYSVQREVHGTFQNQYP